METTVKQRLTEFIQSEGLSVKSFEKRCSLSNSYLRSLRHAPSDEKLSLILSAFPYLDRTWLLAGVGEMYRPGFGPGGEVKDDNEVKPEKSYTHGRPYYNVDFTGGFELMVNEQAARPDYLISMPQYDREGVAWCNITGHSMEPEISNGDIIALQEVENWDEAIIYGEIYGVITRNGLRTIKRIRRGGTEDTVTLQPTNPEYDTQDIQKGQIYKLFRVLCAVKRF